jgi:hypothetical protein
MVMLGRGRRTTKDTMGFEMVCQCSEQRSVTSGTTTSLTNEERRRARPPLLITNALDVISNVISHSSQLRILEGGSES